VGGGPNDSGLSRKHIVDSVDASLGRLQTDYIDLYQTHWPDLETPLEETLETLTDLVREGKLHYVGCSNHPAWYLTKALWISDKYSFTRYETVQPHYNLVNRAEVERELKSLCQDQGLGVIPYSPLAGGFLTGKYRRGQDAPAGSRGVGSKQIQKYMANERNWDLLDKLEEIGTRYDKTVGHVALAWLRDEAAVTSPIIGANTVEQLQDMLGVVGFSLTDEERQEIALLSAWEA
jgi:aryl-alcohol dehydrogenase-like predicted oxidoreductase